tara:strand:+ start:2878 stop:3588 length:711 start_codon:yes stop_codon:yes gene_type:complete
MKKTILCLSAIALFSCSNNSQKAIELNSEADSLSYAIGADIANNLMSQNDQIKSQIPDINIEILNNALISNFGGTSAPKLDSAVRKELIQNYFNKQQQQQQQEQELQSQSAIEEGEKFLSENSAKEGVVTLESGLQYKIIEQGNGNTPTLEDEVEVHYHGTLIDGTVFDSSVDRGETISFPVTGVIAGWTEALQLMPVGSKWQLYIPYALAYGERGSGPIGPYSTLIFDVELIAIN